MSKNKIKERLQLMQRPQGAQKLQIVSAQKGLTIDSDSIRLPHRGSHHANLETQADQTWRRNDKQRTLHREESCRTLGHPDPHSQPKGITLAESHCSPFSACGPQGQTAPLQIQRNHPHLHANPSAAKLRSNGLGSQSVGSQREEETKPQCHLLTNNARMGKVDLQTPIRAYQPSPQSIGKSSRITQPVTLSRQQSSSQFKVSPPLPVTLNTPSESLQIIRLHNSPYPIYRTISKKSLVVPHKNVSLHLQSPPSELQSAARSPVRLQSKHKLQHSPSPLLKSSGAKQMGKMQDSIIRCTSFSDEMEDLVRTPAILKNKNPSFFQEKEEERPVSAFLQTVSQQLKTIDSQRKQTELSISRRLDQLSERANSIVRMYSHESSTSPKRPPLANRNPDPATAQQSKSNCHAATAKMQPHRSGHLEKENGQQLRGLILSRIFI